jgi:hypothetical protein
VQVVLAIRLIFLPDHDEISVPHTLKVAALSPDKEKLAEVEGDINLSGPVVPTDWLQGMQVPMAIQFMAGTEGRGDLEITVDGHTMACR